MEIWNIFSAFSLLFCALFFFSFVLDLIKLVISGFRHKPYKIKAVELFNEPEDWRISVLLGVMFLVGMYTIIAWHGDTRARETATEYEYLLEEAQAQTPEMIECDYCYEPFPAEYAYTVKNSKDTICPDCLSRSFDEVMSSEVGKCYSCGNFFYEIDSYGYGLCEKCAQDELTDCDSCGEMTYPWDSDSGYTLCPRCIGQVYNDPRIARAIERWFEE